jgi:hypothetical protein
MSKGKPEYMITLILSILVDPEIGPSFTIFDKFILKRALRASRMGILPGPKSPRSSDPTPPTTLEAMHKPGPNGFQLVLCKTPVF